MAQTSLAIAPTHHSVEDALCISQDHPWDTLLQPEETCLVLPHWSAALTAAAEKLAADREMSVRVMGQKAALLAKIEGQIPSVLTRHISDLLDVYEAFMAPPIMRIRLESVTSRACWKWHRDYTTLRIISTLRGQGTEYLPDPSQPDTIARCKTGEVGLFKGRLFGKHFGLDGHNACVHRSPPWEDTSEPRLLLVIDTPQDFEIDDADL